MVLEAQSFLSDLYLFARNLVLYRSMNNNDRMVSESEYTVVSSGSVSNAGSRSSSLDMKRKENPSGSFESDGEGDEIPIWRKARSTIRRIRGNHFL